MGERPTDLESYSRRGKGVLVHPFSLAVRRLGTIVYETFAHPTVGSVIITDEKTGKITVERYRNGRKIT